MLQFAAAAVVLMLAGQPALAGVACAMSEMPPAAACPMSTHEMGDDCPFAHDVPQDCSQDGCCRTAPMAVLAPAAPAQPKQVAASVPISPQSEMQAAEAAQLAWQPEPAVSGSPPLYLLNRVFRI